MNKQALWQAGGLTITVTTPLTMAMVLATLLAAAPTDAWAASEPDEQARPTGPSTQPAARLSPEVDMVSDEPPWPGGPGSGMRPGFGRRPGPGGPGGPGGPPGPGRGEGPGWGHRRGDGPGPEEGPGGDRPRGESGPLQPDEVDEFLAFTAKHFPQLHERLIHAREQDGPAFRQMLRQMGPPMTQLMRLWREDPDEAERVIGMQKIEMSLREQRRRLHLRNSPSQRAEIETELRELLQQRFELRQARLRNEIEELRRRLDEQKQRLAEQDRDKERIIDEEFGRLMDTTREPVRGPRPGRSPFPTSSPRDRE